MSPEAGPNPKVEGPHPKFEGPNLSGGVPYLKFDGPHFLETAEKMRVSGYPTKNRDARFIFSATPPASVRISRRQVEMRRNHAP